MAKKKKKATRKKKTKGRTSKDGKFKAVNIYIHVNLLALMDRDRAVEQRSRRGQLHLQLCKSYDLDPTKLS